MNRAADAFGPGEPYRLMIRDEAESAGNKMLITAALLEQLLKKKPHPTATIHTRFWLALSPIYNVAEISV